MPTCASRSDCDDDAAVSEVVGYLLVFGILSVILVLSMVAFNIIQERAEANAAVIEGESIAQRVASAVVNAALFVEDNYDLAQTELAPTYLQPLDLPLAVQGRDYSVILDADENQVVVAIDGINDEVAAPLFSASAPANVRFCDSSAHAGRILVSFDSPPDCIQLLED